MSKFENIVIASDLDGTYFATGTKLVERNLERVRYFCENGGHFTFATGRLPIFTRKKAKKFGVSNTTSCLAAVTSAYVLPKC